MTLENDLGIVASGCDDESHISVFYIEITSDFDFVPEVAFYRGSAEYIFHSREITVVCLISANVMVRSVGTFALEETRIREDYVSGRFYHAVVSVEYFIFGTSRCNASSRRNDYKEQYPFLLHL